MNRSLHPPTDLVRARSSRASDAGWFHSILTLAGMALALVSAPALASDASRPVADFVQSQWGLADGLPQVSVQAIAQDREGYIWAGTQNGVARFDGFRATAFRRQNNGGHSLTGIVGAHVDRRGAVWFATDRGVVRQQAERFDTFPNRDLPQAVVAVAEDRDGNILAATATGVQRVGEQALIPHLLQGEAATALLQVVGGPLWIGTRGALVRVDATGVTRFPLHGTAPATPRALAFDGRRVWIATDGGLQSLDDSAGGPGVVTPSAIAQPVTSVVVDRNGSIWAGTRPALYRIRSDDPTVSAESAPLPEPAWVEALLEDRDGNIWVGTRIHGLFRLWDGWTRRLAVRTPDHDGVLWSVALDPQGRLVTGTHNGLLRQEGRVLLPYVDGALLPEPTAYEIAYDSRGRLWVGTRDGLARIESGATTPRTLEGSRGRQVFAIVEIRDDDFWFGTSQGVLRWSGGNLEPQGPQGNRSDQRVRGLLPLDDDSALLATEGGVRRLDGGMISTPAWAAVLDGAFVTAIDPVGDGMALVTTLDRGLGVLADDRLFLLDESEGLPMHVLWGARVIGDQAYVSGADGVIAVALDALRARTTGGTEPINWRVPVSISGTQRGSLRTRCCNGGARSRASIDGTNIWYPTLDGALALETDRLGSEREVPQVLIEVLRQPGAAARPVRNQPGFELGPEVRDLSLTFTAFAFRDPAGLRFRYRLEGYDQDWINAGTRREAFYTNLPHGSYVFRVRAESGALMPSSGDATVRIEMQPRWHERTSTRLALAGSTILLIGAAFTLLLRARTRGLQSRQLQLQALIAERTAELAHANESLRDANRELTHENETDVLTGLRNRRWAANRLTAWISRSRTAEEPARCAVLVMVDLDRFKQINERYGHSGGDSLLRQYAALLERLAGSDAAVVRWGGEEFLLVLPNVPRIEAAARVEALWRAAVEHIHPAPDGKPMVLTSSIGFSCWPVIGTADDRLPWSVALELADAAVFQVQMHVRNSWAGLIATPQATSDAFASGATGRIRDLLAANAISWVNIRPRYASLSDSRIG